MLLKKNKKPVKVEPVDNLRPLEPKRLRPRDIIVTILLLLIALLNINLFRIDFQRTITLRNVEPVGYVVIRENVVQRRLIDHVLWDRLTTESPVYPGDLIRVAPLSAATLFFDANSIDLSENTLIRITQAADGETLQITMNEGALSIATTSDSRRVSVDINGRQVLPVGAAILNITAAEDGMVVQVAEGTARFIDIDERRSREIQAGSLISLDASGFEREDKAVVIMHPALNDRFINADPGLFSLNFLWSRINLDANELLRLEVATDRNFNNILYIHEDLDTQAQIVVDNGLWHWRLSNEDSVLGKGRFIIADGAAQQLKSPVENSVFTYTDELPVVNFQWFEVDRASSYILEICDTPSFVNPQIQRHSQITFFTDSSFGTGTWYWRVKPVFPIVFKGDSSFSQVSDFRVEHVSSHEEQRDVRYRGERRAVAPPQEEQRVAVRPQAEQPAVIPPREEPRPVIVPLQEEPRVVVPPREEPRVVPPPPPREAPRVLLEERRDEATQEPVASVISQPTPPPLLAAPRNLSPAQGRRYTMRDLQTQRSLNFSWRAVSGANAYIFTIYQQIADGGRQQIYRTQPLTRTNYLLEDLQILDRGTFIWQVEAVTVGSDGAINRRGNMAENTFIMDIYFPDTVRVEGAGIMYAN